MANGQTCAPPVSPPVAAGRGAVVGDGVLVNGGGGETVGDGVLVNGGGGKTVGDGMLVNRRGFTQPSRPYHAVMVMPALAGIHPLVPRSAWNDPPPDAPRPHPPRSAWE